MKIAISEHFNYKKLLRFVLPSIFMMIVTSIYGVIDGLFISNFLGKLPFAAINLIMPFPMVLGGMGFMIGTGGTALVSKTVGEGDKDRANRYFTMLIIFAIALGAALTAIGVVAMRPIAVLLGASEEMLDYCVSYGTVLVCFTVFFMLQSIFQSFLAAAEKPKLGLIVTTLAGIVNAVLDALFIAVLDWGVVGAALATGFGMMTGGIIPLVYFSKENGSLLRLVKTKIQLKPILKACLNGSSELFTNVASSFVSMMFNLQLMAYIGDDGVAAYGVLMYVLLVFLAIEIGFTIGSAPIVAYNYGAQNETELKNMFKKSVVIMSISGIALCIFAQLLAIPLAKLFVGYDENLYSLTVHAFRLFSFSFVFSGIAIYSSGFFTALNNGLVSAILSILRSLVFQTAFIFLLPYLFGVDGIWWTTFATELSATVVATVFFIALRKKYNYA